MPSDDHLTEGIRRVLIEEVEKIDGRIAVLLSGGVDSHTLLGAAIAAKKNPLCLTFALEGVNSMDQREARRTAKACGLECRVTILPRSIDILQEDVSELVKVFGLRKKSDIECSWPIVRTIRELEPGFTVLIGYNAERYFALGRKREITYRDQVDPEPINLFRREEFLKGSPQIRCVRKVAASKECQISVPYRDRSPDLLDLFNGFNFKDLNSPKQKKHARLAFKKEIPRIVNLLPHTNLQLGDSGIAKHFRSLIDTNWNVGGWRSPVGIYNALANNRIGVEQ